MTDICVLIPVGDGYLNAVKEDFVDVTKRWLRMNFHRPMFWAIELIDSSTTDEEALACISKELGIPEGWAAKLSELEAGDLKTVCNPKSGLRIRCLYAKLDYIPVEKFRPLSFREVELSNSNLISGYRRESLNHFASYVFQSIMRSRNPLSYFKFL